MTKTAATPHDIQDLLQFTLDRARAQGATDADVVFSDATSVSVQRRLGKPESVMRSEEQEIGLRVLVGQKQAIVSSADISRDTLSAMAARAVDMARAVPEDPYAGIASPAQLAHALPDLDLYDPSEISLARMTEMADEAEDAAMNIAHVTNSDGAECGYGAETVHYAATNGFYAGYPATGFSLSVSVVAENANGMETDYFYDSQCHLADMAAPDTIGREAGTRAAQALDARKGPTKKLPVIFDWRIAGGVVGSLASAISGSAVARGTTMLKNKMDEMVFSPDITIVDDPFLKRGPRSHPFDAEGLAPQKRNMIDAGRLTGWFLDLSSARQLGLPPTGNATRGTSSVPSPRCANFYMLPGAQTPQELVSDIKEGFFVTRLMGSGGNIITGDYSRGAAGFWIENGQIAYPVSEMTIAGNLRDIWAACRPANDLRHMRGVDAPTLYVGEMMVAGT